MIDNIRPMTEADLPGAAQTLAAAFMNDPLQSYTFPDEKERRAKSPAHFTAALSYGYQFGEVYVEDKGAGAVIWLKPGETEITDERAEKAGFLQLPGLVGEAAFGRFFSAISFIEDHHKRDMPEPHWYTMVLGVDPAFQGQGYGKALLKPVLDKARASGTPAYLETAQPANVGYYEKIGFKVLRELTEPTSGLQIWTFRWDA